MISGGAALSTARVFSRQLSMRAAVVSVFGPPENIKTVPDHPEPSLTSDNQVLIDVYASGINPVDTYIRSGVYGRLPPLPYIPGRDGAGVVRKIGSAVTHLRQGDRVWFYDASGTAAEVTVAEKAFPLAEGLSFPEGASIGVPYLTAYRALVTRGHVKKSDRVLIHGASGGVGLACVQLLRHLGVSQIVGTVGTVAGIELVKKNGAHHVVNHRDDGYEEQLRKLAPEGFNVIIEMLANVNLARSLSLLAFAGRVGIVGSRGETTINPRAIMVQEAEVYGVMLAAITPSELAESNSALSALFSSGARPVLKKVYEGLEQLSQAHDDVIKQPGGSLGNLVVKVRD